MAWDGEHHEDCEMRAPCDCGRDVYHSCEYSSCYQCFLDRRSEYVTCIFCDRWHSPEFDTCFACRPQGRDEAARDLKLVILIRDGHTCRYCGITAGEMRVDPRRVADGDDGIRPAVLHIDHILPCRRGGTADPWNLQVLCEVCNVAKSDEWFRGSRHDRARQEVMDAYATYLFRFLAEDEQAVLLTQVCRDDAWRRVFAAYRSAIRLVPSQANDDVVTEDVPPDYSWLDLPARVA